ncbi:MAG: hypothetical protein ACM3PF_04135 [Bacteroidota bacterium]
MWTAAALASTLDFAPTPPGEILLAQRAIADTQAVATPITLTKDEAVGLAPPSVPEVHKSVGRAFLYNVLMPGVGHLYVGNKRGFAHLGLEGVAWTAYLYYHGRGKAKEDQYLAYADEHWDYDKWKATYGTAADFQAADSLIRYFKANNKQHYYEDIGKLNTYSSGWDDVTTSTDAYYYDSGNREFYRGMRNASNNLLRDAKYAVAGSFLNRVVSAVDVLRILRNRTKNLFGQDTRINLHIRTKPFSEHTAVGFEITKQL